MAKIFIDTNIYIDITQRNKQENLLGSLLSHKLYISIMSVDILFYTMKLKVPNLETEAFLNPFEIIDLDHEILSKALYFPTTDLEDNIQLQSAVEANCDYFLTNDKALLKLKFFGKMRIVDSI